MNETKCTYCLWGVRYYDEIVSCTSVDEECPTDEDIKVAKMNGYYAYNGCCNENDE